MKNTFLLMGVLLVVGLMAGSTFAYWTWYSTENKSVVFNVAGNVSDYIVYDEGSSHFVGDFQPTDSYCGSVNTNTTLSFYKRSEAQNMNFLATIHMDINSIGDNISASDDVHWVVTNGDSDISCNGGLEDSGVVVAHGTFNGRNYGESIVLVRNISVTEVEKKYTVWIWIDSTGDNLSELSGDTIDVNVWTRIDMMDSEGANTDTGNVYTVSFDVEGGDVSTLYTEPGENVYTVPETGTYKLEVWGAQGGTGMKDGKASFEGGYGGYSVGTMYLNAGTVLYANVGGQGEAAKDQKAGSAGGYNGGGTGGIDSNYSSSGSNEPGAGGGGATHIATKSGLLSALVNNKNSILIVAGGGGGGSYYGAGGSGGGMSGNGYTADNGSSVPGTQTSGYAFGVGEDGVSFNSGQGGAGSGYYGGGSGTPSSGIPGAGGSGYIGNSLLTNKVMYCYNCTTSSDVSSLTNTTTKVSETPVANYAKMGAGAIRITKVDGSKKVTNGSTYGELPIPTKEGYIFKEWNTQPDGTGETISASSTVNLSGNITLYAIWESATTYLFTANNQYTSVTGGWTGAVREGNGVFSVSPYIFPYDLAEAVDEYSIGSTLNVTWKTYSSSYNGAAYYATNNKIDLTNVSTITFKLTASGYLSLSKVCVMSGTKAWDGNGDWNCAVSQQPSSGTITLDVSSLEGSYHIALGGQSNGTGTGKTGSLVVTEITMEY